MKIDYQQIVEEQENNLKQLQSVVGVKFVEMVRTRLIEQQEIYQELTGIKAKTDAELARYSSPLSNQYFKQIFFNH